MAFHAIFPPFCYLLSPLLLSYMLWNIFILHGKHQIRKLFSNFVTTESHAGNNKFVTCISIPDVISTNFSVCSQDKSSDSADPDEMRLSATVDADLGKNMYPL